MPQLILSHCRICAVLRVIVNLALMSATGHQRRFERAPAISDLLPNIAVSQQTTFRATTRHRAPAQATVGDEAQVVEGGRFGLETNEQTAAPR